MNDRGVRCANKSKIAGGGTQPRRRARPPGAPRAGTAKSVQICSFVLIDCHGLLRKPRNDITGQPICHCEAGAHTGCGNLKLPNLHEPVRFLRPPLRGRGRLRAPPVADEASKKEWQNQGDWRACFARDDRAADSTEHVPALQPSNVNVLYGGHMCPPTAKRQTVQMNEFVRT